MTIRFSVDAPIYDPALPALIDQKLTETGAVFPPETVYSLDVSFDAAVYGERDFYLLPVERNQRQQERLEKQSREEQIKTMIGDILGQQLQNICAAIDHFHIRYYGAAIAGEELGDLRRVDVVIREDTEGRWRQLEQKRKGSRGRVVQPMVFSVIPHRPWLLQHAAKVITEHAVREARKERQKQLEKSAHTPHMVPADRLFTALAEAILAQAPDRAENADALAQELLAQARLRDDWPLEITGENGARPSEGGLAPDSQIDCPEYLVYVARRGGWSLRKAGGLDDARTVILHEGYNLKSVERVVVLHELAPVPFSLYAENCGEIVPIDPADAPGTKRLLLRWENAGRP